jgi:hypothetical protein
MKRLALVAAPQAVCNFFRSMFKPDRNLFPEKGLKEERRSCNSAESAVSSLVR